MRPVRFRHVPRPTPRFTPPLVATAAILLLAFPPQPARAGFHLNEINKILTSYNGDASIQAVEIRMMTGGENVVSGLSIRSYSAAGVLLATHGTFLASLPLAGALTDRKILCATPGFATTFLITPDLVITPGLPLATGQVSFETALCFVNAVAYGNVTVPKNGTTSAPIIPSGLAYVLARTVNNATLFSCPLAEDAAARFAVRSGSSGAPVPFSNNAGMTVNVVSTITGAAETPDAPQAPRAYPNPFRGSIRIESPSSPWIGVFDVRGYLLRVVHQTAATTASYRGDWDGRDEDGRSLPAGIYFIRFGRKPGASVSRVVLLR